MFARQGVAGKRGRHTECELYGAREATRFKASLRAACWSFHWSAAKHPVRSASSAQVHQQLREIQLRINLVPAQVLVRLARIANVRPPRGLPTKKEFFRSTRRVHLTLTYIVIDGNRASEQKMFSSAQ